jgi:hypothetical protein
MLLEGVLFPSGVQKSAFSCLFEYYAVAKFAEDARRRVLRRTLVLQAPDNKADSVKFELHNPGQIPLCALLCANIFLHLSNRSLMTRSCPRFVGL